MKRFLLVALLAAFAVLLAVPQDSFAGRRHKATVWSMRFANTQPWHGDYYHTATGLPVGLIVPPTAHMQTSWGWGVAQGEMSPIYHQYARPYPGDDFQGAQGRFQPTPRWPSHTDQSGVYYIRGPWGATGARPVRHDPRYRHHR